MENKDVRPTWDQYFTGIMQAVAARATCDRGRSGCVISKDKQILVTGYVGSPKGIKHCDEIGHQMNPPEPVHSAFVGGGHAPRGGYFRPRGGDLKSKAKRKG